MRTYRVIYRSGAYTDTDQPPPALTEDIWAIVDLELAGGGDAYQELLRTLDATTMNSPNR